LEDLITYFPRNHENRGNPKYIADLVDGENALVEAVALNKLSVIKVKQNMSICKLVVRDETSNCTITWFNQLYLKDKFKIGQKYKFYGKIKRKEGHIELMSPVFDMQNINKNTGKIIPIYPLTYELSQNILRQIIENGLKETENNLEETLPEYLLEEYRLLGINEAIKGIHFPKDFDEYNKARDRLVYEELLVMQLALLNLKNRYNTNIKGIIFDKNVKISEIINNLPFKLTKAQIRVLEEIESDMENEKMMNRLLQGDVGSRQNYCVNTCCL
jgi:ATP-dependent DNA helicase RecG